MVILFVGHVDSLEIAVFFNPYNNYYIKSIMYSS